MWHGAFPLGVAGRNFKDFRDLSSQEDTCDSFLRVKSYGAIEDDISKHGARIGVARDSRVKGPLVFNVGKMNMGLVS